MLHNLQETSTKQSVKELHVYGNKERQRRLKGGNIVPGVVLGFPTGPLYLISSSDELLIIISPDFFLTPLKLAAFTG